MENYDASDNKFWALEKQLSSFVAFSAEATKHQEENRIGPLAGVTVGVKDIINVAGLPTRNGSAAFAQAKPERTDAAVVARLRASGASIVGKTTTTEFAFTDPTDCRNPYDLNRTPGGSSSGSGAAVAAELVDVALGTQTAGSLCRPAAYCGVIGLKPTYGLLSTVGVTPLSPSFDTVGIIARCCEKLRNTLLGTSDLTASNRPVPARLGKLLLPTAQKAVPETLAAFTEASAALTRDGCPISDIMLTLDVSAIVAAHRCVMLAEAAQAHGHLLHNNSVDLLRPNFRAGLQAGTVLSPAEVAEARGYLESAKTAFWSQTTDVDIMLTLAVPDGAPLLDGTTGFQDWLTPWTVFGGPLVCMPWGLDSIGRPRSVMLAGRPSSDLQVLDLAERLGELSPPMPRPAMLPG